MKPFSKMGTIGSLTIFFVFALVFVARARTQTNPASVNEIIAQIVKVRDFSSGYVSLANSNFAKGTPDYVQSQKLYIAAYSDNTAWNAYVAAAIRAGKLKHLNNDDEYQKLSDTAAKSSTVFVTYVDTKTQPQSRAVLTILSSLADLGIKLWTDVSDKITRDRELTASNFEKATKWVSWDGLVAAPIAPGDSPKPKPSGSSTSN
jgi:hypothetical protein